MFNAILIEKDEAGQRVGVSRIEDDRLPEGDVTVAVACSTVNYKDSMAITGKAPVVRQFPMVPGIDFAGTVTESANDRLPVGTKVVLNGWGVGEKHWGGLAQKARVKAEWLIRLPEALTERQAMTIGTAGYTAMLCVMALEERGVTPDSGDILVTGATGGVGSIAVALLKQRGFRVVAATGKASEADYLTSLGAASVIERSELEGPVKPLAKERWAAAIDTIGGAVLANICAATAYGGTVAACGMAGGLDFPSNVAPFILRGITLAGVDSVMCPVPSRERAWAELARVYDPAVFDLVARDIALGEVLDFARKQADGTVRGRVVVDVNS